MGNQFNSFISILQKNKKILWLLIIIITLLWGYAWVLMKASLEYMGPFTFSSFRFGVGSVTLLLVVWLLKIGLPAKKHWKHLIIVGFLQTTVVFLLVMYGLRFVDAGKSSVLLYSMPLWSTILATKYLGEKITPAKLSGLLIGMVGLLAILGWDIWKEPNIKMIFGEFLIIISSVSWAVANVYYRIKLQSLPKLQVNAYQMFFGTIGIVIATLFMEWGKPIALNVHSIYYILFTGILASALCFTVWFLILSLIDMATATISTLLVPMFGLLFSSLILGEKMSIGVITGSILIIVGIVVAQLPKNKPRHR
ncbi:DMT family transporter [Virgibacillus profundi]|uniref:DMT family transporter n=1 Tax=Virgibacillus profundi TaxID=2024555 RepID=UPI001F0A9A75|nr:DMT family transporter [Virgibacillus profundi]